MYRMLKIEWDAVAGVLAAVTAIVLHFNARDRDRVLSVIQGRIHPGTGHLGSAADSLLKAVIMTAY